MQGCEYWIATVETPADALAFDLHASELVWGDFPGGADEAYEALSDYVKDASAHYGEPVKWYGPLICPSPA